MANYENISKIVKTLHKINFGADDGIIKISDDYDLLKNCEKKPINDKSEKIEFMHNKIIDYCKECDRICHIEENDNFKLCNISHGTHTFDFLEACGQNPKEILNNKEWTDIPVLFLMENPSLDYDIYDYINNETDGKRPAKKWYWIHSDWTADYQNGNGKFEDDTYLKQGIYGRMVFSLINQYKLANAYLTNAVKCGMSDAKFDDTKENHVSETEAKNLSEYKFECIKTCFKKILIKEINALLSNKNDLIIFAFGSRTYWDIKDFMSNNYLKNEKKDINCKIIKMPHPASRLNNDYRKYVLKGKIEEALNDNSKLLSSIKGYCLSEENIKREFKKIWNKDIGEKRTANQYSLKIKTTNSKFTDQKNLEEIIIYNPIQSENDVKIGLGYVFDDDSYWAYNYDEDDYFNYDKLEYYESFKKVIEEIKKNYGENNG